jgi:signal transduction histidine kinase
MNLFDKCVFFILFAINLSAQDNNGFVNFIGEKDSVLTIDKQFVFLEDNIDSEINHVLKNKQLFSKTLNPFVNSGAHNKTIWIKSILVNNSDKNRFIFEFNQTYVDSLQFYILKGNNHLKEYPKKGLYFESRDPNHFLSNKYAYTYPFTLNKKDSIEIFIKAIVNDGSFQVINKVWTEKAYELRKKDIKVRTSYLLGFTGFIILILIMSVVMFLFSKKLMYLYYVGFVLVVFINLLCLRHLISPVIIQDLFLFGNNFLEMLGYLQVFFMLMYANEFFSFKKKQPRFYFLLNYLALTVLTIFVFGLFLRELPWFYKFSSFVSKSLIGVVSIIIYCMALYLVVKKEKMAYYFVVAYFPLLTFVIHFILTALKLTNSYNPIQWEFVIFFEIVVLAIAMAHKYFIVISDNSNYQKVIIQQKEEGMIAVLSAHEEERDRIAKDLHDGVVQQIGSVLLRARNVFSESNLMHKKESQELLQSLENSNEDLRTISHQMMPRTLKEFGLVSAIDDLLNKSLSFSNVNFVFEHFNIQSRIEKKHEIVLFRILQELVNNIIKHSEATKVNVQLFKAKDAIILLVEDNGKGFDVSKTTDGIGVRNIFSRIESVKGVVNFESNRNKGTLVTVKIPNI